MNYSTVMGNQREASSKPLWVRWNLEPRASGSLREGHNHFAIMGKRQEAFPSQPSFTPESGSHVFLLTAFLVSKVFVHLQGLRVHGQHTTYFHAQSVQCTPARLQA